MGSAVAVSEAWHHPYPLPEERPVCTTRRQLLRKNASVCHSVTNYDYGKQVELQVELAKVVLGHQKHTI